MNRIIIALAALLLIFPGCEREAPQEPEAPQPPEATQPAEQPEPTTDTRQARAMNAIAELRDTLMNRVITVAEEDGFPAAVTVCREEAIPLTEEVAQKHNLNIGRTSEKLRNPDNTAPEWFDELAPEAKEGPQFQDTEAGVLRGVAPIRLAAACTNCHGTTDQLADGVAEALQAQYPEDQATGYAAGDLRGYFWVEVD